jgi:hypothetical protein
MYSTASNANKGPKCCTYILRSQTITVDTSSIRRKLHKTPNNFLNLLFFLSASHFQPPKKTLETAIEIGAIPNKKKFPNIQISATENGNFSHRRLQDGGEFLRSRVFEGFLNCGEKG